MNPEIGKIREVEIFVAVLGASSPFTYPEESGTQKLADWTGAHVPLFRADAAAAGSR